MLRDVGRDVSSQITFEDFVNIMTGKMADRNTREEINKVGGLRTNCIPKSLLHVGGD